MPRKLFTTLVTATVVCLFTAATAGASTINIVNSTSGWYDNTGVSEVQVSLPDPPTGNYVAGDAFGFENHNYFVFNLAALSGATVTGATLELWSYEVSIDGVYTVYEVATAPAAVADGNGGVPVFDDLADGNVFGFAPLVATPVDQGYLVTIDLSAALTAIQNAVGGNFVIGGNFSSGSDDYAFGFSEFDSRNRLIVDYEGRVTVPDGGMTMSLLGGALMGLGMLRRRFNG
jgi:hypothetical protein